MSCEFSDKAAARRYRREMAIAGALYIGIVFGAALTLRHLAPPQWLVVILAIAPLAPALMMLRAYLTFVRGMDEFQRRLQTEAVIIAAAVTVFASFAYGFLEEWAGFPHVPLIWVLPVFGLVFGVAQIIVRRRYK